MRVCVVAARLPEAIIARLSQNIMKFVCRAPVFPAWVVAGFFCLAAMEPGFAGTTVTDLRCEGLDNPLGIDATKPRLSWMLNSDERGQRQTAYQILVAGTAEDLQADQGDLWDTGKVDSDRSIQVSYAGRPLTVQRAVFLEGSRLGPGRQRFGLEQTGVMDDGVCCSPAGLARADGLAWMARM